MDDYPSSTSTRPRTSAAQRDEEMDGTKFNLPPELSGRIALSIAEVVKAVDLSRSTAYELIGVGRRTLVLVETLGCQGASGSGGARYRDGRGTAGATAIQCRFPPAREAHSCRGPFRQHGECVCALRGGPAASPRG